MDKWIEVDIPTHKLIGSRWVKCIAEIRDNSTGEIAEYETNEILDDDEDKPSYFNWEHGNYSCDCNREINFFRGRGTDVYNDSDCSDGKYDVNLKNAKNGEHYYWEYILDE